MHSLIQIRHYPATAPTDRNRTSPHTHRRNDDTADVGHFPIALLFFLTWTTVPLWTVLKHPDTTPGFSQAHAYLAATQPQPAHHLGQDLTGQPELHPAA